MAFNALIQQDFIADVIERCESVRVMVLMKDMVMYGKLYISEKRRFLDTLNKGLGMKNSPDKRYLLMDEILLVDHGGDQKKIRGTCLVPRESVAFIGAFDETRPTVSESIDSIKFYPWRKKEPHEVKVIFGNDYSIAGTVYLDLGDKSPLALGPDEFFIPVTDVSVQSSRLSQEFQFKFLALNTRMMVLLSFQI